MPLPHKSNIDLPYHFASNSVYVCAETKPFVYEQEAIPAGADLCGDVRFAESISATTSRLVDGDETAAVLKRDPGELMVRSF